MLNEGEIVKVVKMGRSPGMATQGRYSGCILQGGHLLESEEKAE
jgi:hypothetical protein